MKKLILTTAIVLLSAGAFAQTMSGSTGRIGLKAGVNLARMHASGQGAAAINDVTKDNVGYNVTFFGDFGVANNFFIQPGISLQNKGTKLDGSINVGNNTVTGTNTVNVMAIEVPINAVLRIPTGDAGAFQINAGPYVGFNIDGKSKTNVTAGSNTLGETETNLNFGSSNNDDLSSTDIGANFGLGYRMNNGLVLGANYGMGFTNMIPKDKRGNNDTKYTNRVLGFSIGYSF